VCIFDPAIVEAFKQPEMVREPPDLMNNFEPLDVVPTVGAVLQQMKQDDWERDIILRKHLLTGLAERRTGLYSKFHNNTIYQLGYDHPTTIRNAFMSVFLLTCFYVFFLTFVGTGL
jgi:RNA-dependent RNA polymerase